MLAPLPRLSAEVRDAIAERIDRIGDETFTQEAIDNLGATNPELLQMAHGFASRHEEYLLVMQGFALLYRSLLVQSGADRKYLH